MFRKLTIAGATVLVAVSGVGFAGSAGAEPGNGNGKAVNRPADGSVGKADNKSPIGQTLDGMLDENKGYECDDNKGVGRGNPAHSACEREAEEPR
jgi:hypothetical protein